MKKKDIQTYRTKNKEELVKELRDIQSDLASNSINRYTKQSKNVREDRSKRQKIAILMTIIREKAIEGETI